MEIFHSCVSSPEGRQHPRTLVQYWNSSCGDGGSTGCWGELVPCADGVPCGEAKKNCQGWGMTFASMYLGIPSKPHWWIWHSQLCTGSPKWFPLPTMARSPISSERCLWSLAIWKVPRGRPGRYNSSIFKLKPGMIALFYKRIFHFSAEFPVSDGR